jgi:hypothetical protein
VLIAPALILLVQSTNPWLFWLVFLPEKPGWMLLCGRMEERGLFFPETFFEHDGLEKRRRVNEAGVEE